MFCVPVYGSIYIILDHTSKNTHTDLQWCSPRQGLQIRIHRRLQYIVLSEDEGVFGGESQRLHICRLDMANLTPNTE